MKLSRLTLFLGLLVIADYGTCLDDLIAEESQDDTQVDGKPPEKAHEPKKYSSKIKASENVFGLKTTPKKTVLDFRIEQEGLRASAAGAGKGKPEDDEEKTLAQQVADGKYGLIQNELFPQGSKRPGILSYASNPEVPKDTKENLGGLDKEEIWLAEDHVLVLRGGGFPQHYNETHPTPWSPIDNYVAPPRQVQIPKNPKIPPPFPVQLSENGPLQFIRGENVSQPRPPPFYPPFPFPPPGANNSFPFPVPPGAPPFLPPGAMFLPPPGNMTEFDEDDPSIYYPPRYDFYYPQDNSTAVPPGPLVPGIILPPPPNFFAPERPKDEENETENDEVTTRKPYVAPAYLPSEKRPYKTRTQTKRPLVVKTTTVFPVYSEKIKTTTPAGFTSPIYVPNTPPKSARLPRPTTSRPNHISIPRNKTLKQDIYIISTEPPDVANDIIDLIRDTKPTKTTSLEGISPERHPLRSLIRPQVSVNYIGKVGHLPPSTAFPFPRTEPTPTEIYKSPPGHFITFPSSVTVTPVPAKEQATPTPPNSHATFFYFEEPTQQTPHENDVSASPIDDFLKSHFKEDAPDYLKDVRPVYIPARSKPKQRPKPVYFTPEEPAKLNALEIDNADLSGLQTLPPPTEPAFSTQNYNVKQTTDGPFIPSNYYATANPATMHFTKFDPSIVDDITMKYFTLFGQKLGSGGTTPIPDAPLTTPRTKIVHSYTPSPVYRPGKIIQAYQPPTTTESPRTISITTGRPRPTPQSYAQQINQTPRTKSHFEQYLQEITGEDQTDHIVTHKTPVKIKKPKSRPVFNEPPRFQQYYLPSYRPGGFSEYIESIYRQPSTTLRPVSDVQVQPQYHISHSTTLRPFTQTQPPHRGPQPLSHNLGQYLQEVTYSGPKPPGSSNLQYFDASAHNPVRQKYQKPISLESDVLVNYRQPLPAINPDAELLPTSYASSQSNIQVVQAPDLTRNRQYTQQYRTRPQFEPAKQYYENLPQSKYLSQQQSNNANAFVAYNLPDNGGHFYFLTPQALDRSDTDVDDEEGYGTVKRSNEGPIDRLNHRRAREREQSPRGDVSTSQEYLRRRRKKS